MEIGIYTFADLDAHPVTGEKLSAHQRMMNLMEEAALADELGLDVFAVGEHHRPDYAVSAPAVVLAAVAMKTKSIRLSSAVSVLSSDDPVRVYQQYSIVDLLSGGRAEIMVGRGSFIESFPLFGYDLSDYESLFSEKLEMLLRINASEPVSWQGRHTQSLKNALIFPRPYQERLPVWVAVGGTPESVERAAGFGLPMALAIIGGTPDRFVPFVDLYRDRYRSAGHDANSLQLSINSLTYIADSARQARDEYFPVYAASMGKLGRERGWPPITRAQFEASTSPQGALIVGSPEEVVDKILYEYELFGHTRYLAQISLGAMPHGQAMRAIELLGTRVAPAVKKALA
ncbi:MAG TPA: Atu2307/SP_0267 family LLM class monooxygenase [Chitinophagaceae bacterium]